MDNAKIILSHLTLSEVNRICSDHGRSIITLTQRGDEWIGNCPTGHKSDSKKCFNANEAERKFHCHSCKAGGDFIHLVQLIIFGEVTKGKSQTINETFKILSARFGLGSPGIMQNYKERRKVFDVMRFAFDHYHAQFMAAAHRDGFLSHYGFTKEFAIKERIGFGGKSPYQDTVDKFSEAEALATGLFFKGGDHIHKNRFVFPYELNGERVYSIGREKLGLGGKEKYKKQMIGGGKNDYVSHQVKNVILITRGQSKDIVITEGITDYLTLKQAKIHTCSPVTVGFKDKDIKELVEISKNYKFIYIANDNDGKSHAGAKGAAKTAEELIKVGINPYIIELPLPEGAAKIDINEYIKKVVEEEADGAGDAARDAMEKLKRSSKTYIYLQVEKIDKDYDGEQLYAVLDPILDLLKHMSEEVDDYYVDLIKKRFGLTPAVLKKKLTAKRKEFDKTSKDVSMTDNELLDSMTDFSTCLKKGQDFIGGKLIYTRALHIKNGNKLTPFPVVISSGPKKWERLENGISTKSGLTLKEPLDLDDNEDWWTPIGSDFSAQKYMKGETDIDPAKLFVRIKDFFSTYIYLPNNHDYDTLALNAMATSNFMIFNTVGYLHFLALKNSGKTTVMSMIGELAFKATMSASRSDSTIYRATEDGYPTMIFDETDDWNRSKKLKENAPSLRIPVCNAGYQKDGKVYRSDGDKHKTKAFSCFGHKYFGGTQALDPLLSSRTINIEMTQPPEGTVLERAKTKKYKAEGKTLRDQICCYGLQHVTRIAYIYEKVLYQSYYKEFEKNGVGLRDFDLYESLLCQALLIDEFDSSLKVFDSIKEKSFKGAVKKKLVSEKDPEMEVLEKFYLFAKGVIENPPARMDKYYHERLFLKQGVITFFIQEVLKSDYEEKTFDDWTFPRLESMLKKMDVLEDSDIRQNMDIKEGGVRKRGRGLKIDLDRILRKLLLIESSLSGEIKADIAVYKEKNNLLPPKSQIEIDEASLD